MKVMRTSLRTNEDKLSVTFVPHGILINGKPSRPKVESSVRIGQVSLAVESQKRVASWCSLSPAQLRGQRVSSTSQFVEML
jgi:hypothetical protein